jgi:hypothetical protein
VAIESIDCEAFRQLEQAGYRPYLTACSANGTTLFGTLDVNAIERLTTDPRFANGVFYGYHRDVGGDLTDFRSYRGAFGRGSLQLVVDRQTGQFYADIDKFNVYQDVVGFIGHAFGEVVPHWFKKWWRKNKVANGA